MYLYHITMNTRHSYRSERADIPDDVILIMRKLLDDMLSDKQRVMITNSGNVSCRLGQHNGKMIEFIISVEQTEYQLDVIRFVVCRHSRAKAKAWALANGKGHPPQVPFAVTTLLISEFELIANGVLIEDISVNFEKYLAWAWLTKEHRDE